MTIKEIAKLTGKSESTIRNWLASAKTAEISAKIAEARKTSKPSDFTLEETIAIIRAGGNDTLADLLQDNATKNQKTTITKREVQIIQVAVRQVTEDIMAFINSTPSDHAKIKDGQLHLSAPEKNERDQLNQIIRKYSSNQSIPHAVVWGQLYNELYYRLSINVRKRAQNRNMPIIDYIESEGLLPQALSVAQSMFR